MRAMLFGLLLVSALFVSINTNTSHADAPAAKAKPAAGKVVKIALIGSDQMQFNLTEIKVPKGSTVELTLTHGGKLPVTAMGHNFVLLKKGVDITTFATKAMSAGASGYVHPDQKDQIVARTELVGGGASTTITFTAPEAGTYDYICTFPGHYALMKGKFIVE